MVATIHLDAGSSDEEGDNDDVIMVVHPPAASDPSHDVDLVKTEPDDAMEQADEACSVDFESEVPTPSTPAEDAEGDDDSANHRPQLRRLPRLNLDNLAELQNANANESDDATGSPGMVLAIPANPQGGDFSTPELPEFDQNENENSQSGNDLDMQSDSSISQQSWRPMWDNAGLDTPPRASNNGPSSTGIEGGMLPDPNWGIPPSGPPDSGGPHLPGVTDREVITVFFEHTLHVEMRFNPGMRHGIPNTQVRPSHWSLVHCNF